MNRSSKPFHCFHAQLCRVVTLALVAPQVFVGLPAESRRTADQVRKQVRWRKAAAPYSHPGVESSRTVAGTAVDKKLALADKDMAGMVAHGLLVQESEREGFHQTPDLDETDDENEEALILRARRVDLEPEQELVDETAAAVVVGAD